jgi:hypothetical protein
MMVVTSDRECFLILADNSLDCGNQCRSILEFFVQDAILQSGWGNFLIAVLFAGILLMCLFRLDGIIASPRRGRAVNRPASGCDEDGRFLLSDPDGRPWSISSKTR